MRLTGLALVLMTAIVLSAAAAAGPYDHPSPVKNAPATEQAPPANPQDPIHQCRLGCGDSCKAFGNPALRQQCLDSCYSKCAATYER